MNVCKLFIFIISFSMQATTFDSGLSLTPAIEEKTHQVLGIVATDLLDIFNCLYEKNYTDKKNTVLKIPKIIHQIWIGEQVPQQFVVFQKTIQKLHPDWEYKLWSQYDIEALKLQNYEYIKQSRNPAEISDLMRYEILYHFGGVYLDMDCESLRSLNDLHYIYDLYIGMQPLDSGLVQLGIGVIGCCPGHPFLKACINNIKNAWSNSDYVHNVAARTGPLYCTKIFHDYAAMATMVDIVLPPYYFYPLGCNESSYNRNDWLNQGSYIIHHWAKSWLYPSFRREPFCTIKNY